MKFILSFLVTFCFLAQTHADYPNLRRAVLTPAVLVTSSTNVTSSAYVTFVAVLTNACSAVQIHNTGAQPIKLAVGAAASEVDTGIVFPIGVSILVPEELKKGVRLAVKSMGSTQSSGLLVFTCFQ